MTLKEHFVPLEYSLMCGLPLEHGQLISVYTLEKLSLPLLADNNYLLIHDEGRVV